MSRDTFDGKTMTFIGVSTGGWFGEGTALKREPYRYNIVELRDSVVAGISVEAFHWLLDHSIAFNKYLMRQFLVGLSRQRVNVALKALAAQGVIRLEYGRLTVPDIRKLTHPSTP